MTQGLFPFLWETALLWFSTLRPPSPPPAPPTERGTAISQHTNARRARSAIHGNGGGKRELSSAGRGRFRKRSPGKRRGRAVAGSAHSLLVLHAPRSSDKEEEGEGDGFRERKALFARAELSCREGKACSLIVHTPTLLFPSLSFPGVSAVVQCSPVRSTRKNSIAMSWTEYLSNLKKEGLKHAAICGADGSWIQVSDGSNVSSIRR